MNFRYSQELVEIKLFFLSGIKSAFRNQYILINRMSII